MSYIASTTMKADLAAAKNGDVVVLMADDVQAVVLHYADLEKAFYTLALSSEADYFPADYKGERKEEWFEFGGNKYILWDSQALIWAEESDTDRVEAAWREGKEVPRYA